MRTISRGPCALLALAMLTVPAASVAAQELGVTSQTDTITVEGSAPADLTGLEAGPEIEGIISARTPNQMRVTNADGTATMLALSDATEIRGRGGFLGLNRTPLASDALLNGLDRKSVV